MRFLIALALNALIWIGLGKGGAELFFPELMASPFAVSVPIIMMWGGLLTALVIVSNLFIFSVGNK